MKTLELNQMENVSGGKLVPCGEAMFWGSWIGGIVGGGVGAIVGAGLVAIGPNCLGLWDPR